MNSKDLSFNFTGKGSALFGITIVNLLLTIITFGLYYPWAKANLLKFIYQETQLDGTPFNFHGTGKEMFKGFIKAILIFALLQTQLYLFMYFNLPLVGILIFYICILLLIPIIIHGSLKYRLSRSSWRGIHFGYRGEIKPFGKIFFINTLLTIITFGIYYCWLIVKVRKYTIGNSRFGNVSFSYHAEGKQLLWLMVSGYFLSLFTFGIYTFWWMKDIYNFLFTNITIHQEQKNIPIKSTISGLGLLKLNLINLVLIVFTLGIGFAWAQVRTYKYLSHHLLIGSEFDTETVVQTEEEYKDATADDMGDMLDLNII